MTLEIHTLTKSQVRKSLIFIFFSSFFVVIIEIGMWIMKKSIAWQVIQFSFFGLKKWRRNKMTFPNDRSLKDWLKLNLKLIVLFFLCHIFFALSCFLIFSFPVALNTFLPFHSLWFFILHYVLQFFSLYFLTSRTYVPCIYALLF